MSAFPGVVRRTPLASLAASLERGLPPSKATTWMAATWAARARAVHTVDLPVGTPVVGISGPTLGGSYKTPVTVALAEALAAERRAVAVVSHGYRARLGRAPRIVTGSSPVSAVGDDALAAARALAPYRIPVVVGPRREEALAFAASLGEIVIVDGLLQTAPRRLSLSVLAVDAEFPFGAGSCPPLGDLRAPRAALLEAADVTVSVGDGAELEGSPARSVLHAELSLVSARGPSGERVPLATLRAARVGVVVAIARPERVLRSLARAGIEPVETRLFGDHGTPRPHLFRPSTRPDVWLTTDKCATKLGGAYDGAPLLVLEPRILLPGDLVRRSLSCFRAPGSW